MPDENLSAIPRRVSAVRSLKCEDPKADLEQIGDKATGSDYSLPDTLASDDSALFNMNILDICTIAVFIGEAELLIPLPTRIGDHHQQWYRELSKQLSHRFLPTGWHRFQQLRCICTRKGDNIEKEARIIAKLHHSPG